MTQLVDYKQ